MPPLLHRDSLTTYIIFILPLFVLALIAAFNMATKPINHNLNVLKKPLALFSPSAPTTGFYRDGYCRTGPDDSGNHAIAAVLTDEFLDFSAARGNNLRVVPGVKEGCKWCLCSRRWMEAVEAVGKGKAGKAGEGGLAEGGVPRVFLHATDESALKNGVTMEVLKKYAAEPEASGGGGNKERKTPIEPGTTSGSMVKETH